MRLAKYLSQCGVCSRREAERWIQQGRIQINGVTITTPVTLVTEKDLILVDHQPIHKPRRPRLWRYYKPCGLLCTRNDPQGRPTIFEALPFKHHFISMGRLDLNSEGLLLITTEGAMVHYGELPQNRWKRIYQVRVHGIIDTKALYQLRQGITIEGIHYGSVEVDIIRQGASNTWLYMALYEGKNREIRRILAHLGLQVNRLKRMAYGPFELGNLKPGEYKEVPYAKFCQHFPFLGPC